MKNTDSNKVLIIPQKSDLERDSVAEAWIQGGGEVLRLDRFWEPPVVESDTVRLYGNSVFCMVLAEKLSLQLVSPDDAFLLQLSADWLKRSVHTTTLGESDTLSFPCFAKPVVPKLFRAGIYASQQELLNECIRLEAATGLLLSEIVPIEAEARAFILNNDIVAFSIYEGSADAKEGTQFLKEFLKQHGELLPQTAVVDIAYITDRGWAILEANASWGAGLNGCDPVAVLPCIDAATQSVVLE